MSKEQQIYEPFTIIVCRISIRIDCLAKVYGREHACNIFKNPLRVWTSLHRNRMCMVFGFKKMYAYSLCSGMCFPTPMTIPIL